MIKCKWRELNQVIYNIDGQVYPCCYLVNVDYTSRTKAKEDSKGFDDQHIMSRYNEYKDELNIFKNDIDSINMHPWWDELIESWSNENTLRQCKRWCQVDEDTEDIS